MLGIVNKLLKTKSLLTMPSNVLPSHQSKLSRPKFEFSLKVKGLNPDYLLKSFLLYKYQVSSKVSHFLWNSKVKSFCQKVHSIFYEVRIFIKRHKKPLGFVTEQKYESAHQDMKHTEKLYKRAENHPDFPRKSKDMLVCYNGLHI